MSMSNSVLGEAVNQGLVDVFVEGHGPGMTSRCDLTISPTSAGPVNVVIPRGTQLVPDSEGYQVMVVTEDQSVSVGGGGSTAGDGGPVTVTVPTVCASPFGFAPPPVGGGGVGYHIPQELSPAVAVLDTVNDLSPGFEGPAAGIGLPLGQFLSTLGQYVIWSLLGTPPGVARDPSVHPYTADEYIATHPTSEDDKIDPERWNATGGRPSEAPGRDPAVHHYTADEYIATHPTSEDDKIDPERWNATWARPTDPPKVDQGPVGSQESTGPPGPGFGKDTIHQILFPQLQEKGATPEQVDQIVTTFWDGVDTTVKALNERAPGAAAAVVAAGVPTTVADAGPLVAATSDTGPGAGEEFEDKIFAPMRNAAAVRGLRHEYDDEAPDPNQPIILQEKGKLYRDVITDRAQSMSIIQQERDTWIGWGLDQLGLNRTVNYANTVIARCDEEKKDFDERERLHGTVGAANTLWDERNQQWATYRWAIFNCFAVPIANAFGGLQAAGGNILQITGQILSNLSTAPDEMVEWMTGEDPETSGGVAWRKVFGVTGTGLAILGGTRAAFGNLPRPPKSQFKVPRGGVTIAPPPVPAAPGAGRRMAPIPPPLRRMAPIPPPMPIVASTPTVSAAQYQAEHQAMAAQIRKDIATANVGVEGTHWTSKRAVNCPYTALACDQHFAGTPMPGIPPFRHVDGIGFLETHYGGKFRPTTVSGLGANLYKNPGSRGIVYVVWKTPPNTPRSAHVFNVISVPGRPGSTCSWWIPRPGRSTRATSRVPIRSTPWS